MLPQGFTRVEWIESTGTQKINTNVIPDASTVLDITFECKSGATTEHAIFGASWSINGFFLLAYSAAKGLRWHTGGKSVDVPVSNMLAKHRVICSTTSIAADGTQYTVNATQADEAYPIELFSVYHNDGNYGNKGVYRLYPTTIQQGGTLVRDYIPCIDENGNANLWDDVNETLAEKVGTFLYGAPVVPESLSGLVQINTQAGAAFSWEPSEYANEYVIARDSVKIATVYGNVTSYTDTDAPELSTYTVTPYNGKQAGTGSSITILAKLDAPGNLNAVLDGLTVTLTWGAVSGAEGYKVYRDGTVVASVASASYTDTLTPPASVAYAVSAYKGTIQSEISRIVVVENWEGVLLTLITDRTAADVAEAKRLRDKLLAGETLTDEESVRYFAGLRGAYNASDMNRVGAAVQYVANRLNAEGYSAYVSPKTGWHMEDIVRQSDWNKYLDEVRHLRRKLTLMRTTPQITDGMYSGLKRYAEANAIEQILVDLDWMLTNIIRDYIYAGEVFAGEV